MSHSNSASLTVKGDEWEAPVLEFDIPNERARYFTLDRVYEAYIPDPVDHWALTFFSERYWHGDGRNPIGSLKNAIVLAKPLLTKLFGSRECRDSAHALYRVLKANPVHDSAMLYHLLECFVADFP